MVFGGKENRVEDGHILFLPVEISYELLNNRGASQTQIAMLIDLQSCLAHQARLVPQNMRIILDFDFPGYQFSAFNSNLAFKSCCPRLLCYASASASRKLKPVPCAALRFPPPSPPPAQKECSSQIIIQFYLSFFFPSFCLVQNFKSNLPLFRYKLFFFFCLRNLNTNSYSCQKNVYIYTLII